MTYNEKTIKQLIRKNRNKIQNNYICIHKRDHDIKKRPNIQFMDIINRDTHKEIIAKLDYDAPSCPYCGSQMKKYDFQKPSKIPYKTTGMPTRILLKKRRFSAIIAW